MDAFRAYLEEWMARTGTTQAELGRRSGVAQNVISQWLGPVKRRPSDGNLRKLAPVIGVGFEDLMRMAGYFGADASSTQGDQVDPDLAAVNAVWARLPDWRQKAIKALADVGARGITSYKQWDPVLVAS